jgi:hypothetical protein
MHRAQMREEAAASQPAELPRAEAEPVREPIVAAPAIAPSPDVAPAPTIAREPAPAPKPAVTPPPVDVREALETSGLQMVETRPDRVRAPAPEAEPVALGRPRRERPRAVETEAPLVQVETKH